MNFIKMNRVIILCGLMTFTVSAVISPDDAQAKILKYESSNDGTGNYRFSYETTNGITREEIGYLVNVGQEGEHMVVQGSYSYTDDEGQKVVTKYTADENGYHINPPKFQFSYSGVSPALVATLLGK